MISIKDNQIIVMTGAQLKEFAAETARQTLAVHNLIMSAEEKTGKRYVYGLRGISELFNVSIVTAQKYKNTFLAPAIIQRGRKLVTDVDKAMELFNACQHKLGKNV